MKIELMIYVYIAICVSMIVYNIIYVFVLRHREVSLNSNSEKFEKIILDEIGRIKNGEGISSKHIRLLRRKLDGTAGITAFDKALERVFEMTPEYAEKYIVGIFCVFEFLTERYMTKDTIKIAYFPYILHKYKILKYDVDGHLTELLFELLRSVNVYCRENTLRALYSMENTEITINALRIIDKNLSFHHPKLICDGLVLYNGDKQALKDRFFSEFGAFSVQMRVNVLNYFRFGDVRCDEEMLSILADEKEDNEIRYSAIRYFEKYPNENAKHALQAIAENLEGRTWEYQAIATSALKSYPDDVTFRILVKNLSSSNWHVRQNSAISCEKLGYTYHDLISVFDGDDRYAREIMRYRLDRRNAADKAVVKQ